ncbi:N-acetylglutamate synthase [Actinoplanes sp. SE50]|uniref:bifunctional glutamate N-acetyltransferase/amino-acid acetyltransferase ArgJ n=1 Tax=unclassified Actinoplanes TaxID=2626549 RepID=UPI00023ED2FB|nr:MULTISPECIES: bifunctional glutamate N-acetyltransferase/amino-acid acetyltransferase ArgJ [unclassified Actinoplanes]AEV87295.1 bifunctional ornithine acetyltransferase/N-acetylglutamate synthase protein [Actinoplanes sp. SE50/110]ATO85695.1 N-acetylglutamate synthase [Actinoplanes sp. SE50]SLM03108.1 bifunctional ornithine acetyltransferase/N-acetylglutamate synthase [Actinoplanes sp. SE50/110]
MTVTHPRGFRASGVAAGLKTSGNPDVALVVNDGPDYTAAAVFTGNRVKAAPVLWSQQVVKGGVIRAVVLNSGGANACTGSQGFRDTHTTAEHTATVLRTTKRMMVGPGDIAVCSTGLIGELLPMDRLLPGVNAAVKALATDGGPRAAEAIMTTDTVAKNAVAQRDGWSVGGIAKGAGMLAPALATMLVVITTDASADNETLDAALRAATRVTFDRIDADGCMSTNDTVLLLASGASDRQPTLAELTAAVTEVCHDLAQQLIADAEGATKHIAIEVAGAASEADAVQVGRTVAGNNLVKTAFFGNDPNWGRILAAVGTTSAAFEADRIDVAINGVWVCRNGAAAEDRSKVDLSGRDVRVTINLHEGEMNATIWTTDLSHAYVHENSAYSS